MFFDSRGTPIQMGQELGRGGEGTVYDVPGNGGRVAKLYFSPPNEKKQAKLTFMAQSADASLLKHTAWPQETLHKQRGGPVVGFLMGKVAGKDPVHMVYGPKQRRQKMPNMGWDFLLYTARNTAAAFDTLHTHGHVLGDVNQGNVMVGGDSQVILIDSDSYQIQAGKTVHLCEVGVSHFTPPELQRIPSFNGVTRTANHDNFGLALLIFHLLFGGRHPYSGVPLRKGVADSLETDIKAHHYAYARDANSRGISPPPGSIPLSMVPDNLEAMFHQAFTERGVHGRPSAKQWVLALDAQGKQLKKCIASRIHIFPSNLATCPWCSLEQKGVIYFVDLGSTFAHTANGFVLAQVWVRILAVPPPPQPSIPDWRSYSPIGKPLSAAASEKEIAVGPIVVMTICFALFFIVPQAWFLWGGGFVWAVLEQRKPKESAQLIAERDVRRLADERAQSAYDVLVARMKREAGPEGFNLKRRALEKIKTEYEQIDSDEAKELEQLKQTGHERQKQQFLDRFFIEGADIPGVGPARKTALKSFGIETAADVTKNAVMQVRGFGPNLTRAVLDWRASCERRFQFNPNLAVTDNDRNAVRAKHAVRKKSLEPQLSAGAAELTSYTSMAKNRLDQLRMQAETAAKVLAQTRADLAVI